MKRRSFLKGVSAAVAATALPSPDWVKLPDFPPVKTFGANDDDSLIGFAFVWKEAVKSRWNLPRKTEQGTSIFVNEEDAIVVVAYDDQWFKILSEVEEEE
jgi:hypothetical protein